MVDETNHTANAPNGEPSQEAVPSKKTKSLKSKWLFLGFSSLLIAIGATTFYWMKKDTHDASTKGKVVVQKVNYFEIPNIVVNLRQLQKTKKPVYLKMTIFLEASHSSEIEALNILKPRIVDQLQVYLREMTVEDFAASEGGLQRLREELLIRVNGITAPLLIKNLLFKDILIQ